MKKKTTYTDDKGEIRGELRRVRDTLPHPAVLARQEKLEKVTITLNKSSVDFFRREAKRYRGSYQRMIRNLLTAYAAGRRTG